MTFYVQIDLLNEAMQTGTDVATLLRELADKLDDIGSDLDSFDFPDIKLRDLNGNTIGKAYTA